MGKGEPSGSGSSSDSELEESENSEKVIEEEEEEEEEEKSNGISEYEKQRLSRIAENKARMEALGLHKMASSLMASSSQKSYQSRKTTHCKGKSKVVDDDDDDYLPNEEDDDEDFVDQSSSKSRRNKVKSKVSKPNKKVPFQKSADYIDEDDDELMRAIALSLQDSAKDGTFREGKKHADVQEDTGRRKRRKSLSNRVQMTDDELVLHFFQFDEEGRGFLTVRDLRRLATAHDFTWTDRELADMIHFFDADGDGKLNLDDFHKIVEHCNMIQGSECS